MYYVLSTVVTELVLILPYFEGAIERSSLEIIFKLTHILLIISKLGKLN